MRYYVFFCKGYHNILEKCHDLVSYHFPRAENFTIKKDIEVSWVLDFIERNKANKDVAIIFYSQQRLPYEIEILDKLSQYDPKTFRLKIFFFTFDFWIHRNSRPNDFTKYVTIYNTALRKLFQAKNHYVFTFCRSLSELNKFRGVDYSPYANRILFNTNVWCVYRQAIVPFNEHPEPKIFVSGCIHNVYYPERFLLRKKAIKDTDIILSVKNPSQRYNDDFYTQELNKYLCAFASSVHFICAATKKVANTHIILQKVFEILASGSLLLCPKTEEPYLNEIGLVDGVNMKIVDMNSFDVVKAEILHPANRKIIDGIRLAGYKLAQEKFTSEKKFQEIMEKMSTCTST
jgi:hypothetical protein